MQNILNALEALAKVSSTNEKLRLLQESKSAVFSEIFKLAYDPFITFGVHKIDLTGIEYSDSEYDEWYDRLLELTELLRTRRMTGNAAKNEVRRLLRQSSKRQATLLMNILNKDLRIGVGVRVINKVYAGLLPDGFCMSAMKYDIQRVDFPVYADTKLDGVRCIALIGEDKITLFSRNGKEFKNYTTIEEELKNLKLPIGIRLDGEITMGHFQNLMRTISRKGDGIELAKDAIYNIFDIQDDRYTFEERTKSLHNLQNEITANKLTHLKIVKGKMLNNECELIDFYNEILASGEEGVMIKPLDGMYEMKRSWAWQKMKPCNDIDIEIIDVQEGAGKYINMLGAFICKLPNNNTVQVGSGLTEVERQDFWKNKEALIGKMIEVRFQEWTKNKQSIRFPVFKRFRPDKE